MRDPGPEPRGLQARRHARALEDRHGSRASRCSRRRCPTPASPAPRGSPTSTARRRPHVTSATTGSLAFTATTNRTAETVGWSLDGTPKGPATGNDTDTFTFTWNLGTPSSGATPAASEVVDGEYTVAAKAFDSFGAYGPAKVQTIVLNRRAPYAPQNFKAVMVDDVVEAEWTQGPERDMQGFRLYRRAPDGQDAQVADTGDRRDRGRGRTALPTTGTYSYFARAVDKDTAGTAHGRRQRARRGPLGQPLAPAADERRRQARGRPGRPELVGAARAGRPRRRRLGHRLRRLPRRPAPGRRLRDHDDDEPQRHGGGRRRHTYWVVAVDGRGAQSARVAAQRGDVVRGERGETTLIGLLVAASLFIVVLGATLSSSRRARGSSRDAQIRADQQDRARVAVDGLTKQLRNLASPTPDQPDAVDRATGRDLIFKTVDPVGPNTGTNDANVKRLRYCLDASTAPLASAAALDGRHRARRARPRRTAPERAGTGDVVLAETSSTTTAASRSSASTRRRCRRSRDPRLPARRPRAGEGREGDRAVQRRLPAQPEPRARRRASRPSVGATEIVLNGSASSDPEGDPLTYIWKVNGTEIGRGRRLQVQAGQGHPTRSRSRCRTRRPDRHARPDHGDPMTLCIDSTAAPARRGGSAGSSPRSPCSRS